MAARICALPGMCELVEPDPDRACMGCGKPCSLSPSMPPDLPAVQKSATQMALSFSGAALCKGSDVLHLQWVGWHHLSDQGTNISHQSCRAKGFSCTSHILKAAEMSAPVQGSPHPCHQGRVQLSLALHEEGYPCRPSPDTQEY